MNVETIMSTQLITLDMGDDLEKANKLFDENNIHHVLITHHKKLVGVITDRDVFKHLSPSVGTRNETAKDTFLLNKKIHLMMSRELVTAKANTSLIDAVLLFDEQHISCLPVVNNKFEAIGIITWRDIVKVVANNYRVKNKET